MQYFYDAANRLTNVVESAVPSGNSASLFYDDLGRRTKLVLPNGINVLYFYDTASRLTNITYQGAATNRIVYSYDQLGSRVAQASPLANYLVPSAVASGTYNNANQQLTFGSYNMLYDANGNVTNITNGTVTNQLVWNARNQLTNMTGAVNATYRYDGLGRRVENISQRYLYDGLDAILSKQGPAKYLNFRGLAIDEPWQQAKIINNTTNSSAYLADALGSIVALTDTGKVIKTEYDYEPFGATTTTGAGNNSSYKFTAREDDGTGLYYYRARYYHHSLGRFVSEDPIEYAGEDINLYSYVFGNPIVGFDPLGLLTEKDCIDRFNRCMLRVNEQAKEYGVKYSFAYNASGTLQTTLAGIALGSLTSYLSGLPLKTLAGPIGVAFGGARLLVGIYDITVTYQFLYQQASSCTDARKDCEKRCE